MFGLIDMEIDGIISGSMGTRLGVITNAKGRPLTPGSPAYKRAKEARKTTIASAAKARAKAAAKKPKKKAAAVKSPARKKAATKKPPAKKVAAKKASTGRPPRR